MTAALRHSAAPEHVPPARLVVIRQAPRREPPFDDELPAGQPVGRHDQRLPFDRPVAPMITRLPQRMRVGTLPDPGVWGHRLLVSLIEIAAGRRPFNQLAPMMAFPVARGIGSDLERAAHAGSPHWLHRGTVRSVRATEPTPGIAELCATVETGRRVRAVAMRLESHADRWRCTRLHLG